jgi:hypothetical protein
VIAIARWAEASACGWPSRTGKHVGISHRRGGVRGSSLRATSSARFPRQQFHDRVLSAMAPGSSPAGRLANSRATPAQDARATGSHPLCPSAPAQAHRGSPLGVSIWGEGRRPCPHERHPSQDQGCRGHLLTGICQKGSVEPGNLRACRGGPLLELAGLAGARGDPSGAAAACQRTRASGIGSTLHPGRMGRGTAISWRWDGHAFFGPMRLRRRATRDAALPGAGAAGFTLLRVIGR